MNERIARKGEEYASSQAESSPKEDVSLPFAHLGAAIQQMKSIQEMVDQSPRQQESRLVQAMADDYSNNGGALMATAGFEDTTQMAGHEGAGIVQATFDEMVIAASHNLQDDLRYYGTNQKILMRQIDYVQGNLKYLFETYQGETAELRKISRDAKKMKTTFEAIFKDASPGSTLRIPDTAADKSKLEDACEALLSSLEEPFEEFEGLIESTRHVRPHKKFTQFMGDDKKYAYHRGTTAADAIPVYWYKSVDYYDPIVTSTATYHYPNGPQVTGNRGTYKIKVTGVTEPKIGSVFYRQKDVATRNVQEDINEGLKNEGVDLSGLDGDHVQDLSFRGRDNENNYWPLDSDINRRPFNGWSGLYGVNVINPATGQGETKVIDDLYGRYFKIVGMMPRGGGAVPAIGKVPDVKSGAD